MAQKDENEMKNDSNMDKKYDIVIYGATGFTGSIAASEFLKQYATRDIHFKWAISGRNQQKLEKLRVSLQKEYKSASSKDSSAQKNEYIANLPIILANVKNEQSLKSMITSTKLVISCIGPYRLVGEKVLELCAHNGTHYVDICGEPDFMERCAFKYYEIAQKTGALIVSACGFDSIPSDIGCLFIEQYYLTNGGLCSSINGYLTGTAPDGYPTHHTTLKAAVLGLSEADKLRALRKQIKEKDYRIERKKILRVGRKQKVKKDLYFWSEEVKKYSMLFPFADSAVVSNSQGIRDSLLRQQKVKNQTFPQYAAYISFNSYMNVMQAVGIGGISTFLVNYEFGRNLLTNYPSVMTMGTFSEEGPTEKQRASQTWSFKFYAKGYSKELCSKYGHDLNKLNALNCDYNVNASVSGKDIGYSGTCKMLIQCAMVLLEEEKKINDGDLKRGFPAIKGGVFTPSTVFGNTSLVKRLNESGTLFVIEEDADEKDDQKNDE